MIAVPPPTPVLVAVLEVAGVALYDQWTASKLVLALLRQADEVFRRERVPELQRSTQNEKPTIFLQRHGESAANTSEIYACRRLDPELTERGRSQVEANATLYGDVGIRRILSSPSKRAVQTAEIIGSVLGLEPEVNAALMEVNVGDFEGESYHSTAYSSERFFSIFEDWLVRQKDTRFPGGESRQDVEERLEEMESLLSPCPTILVGHGAVCVLPWAAHEIRERKGTLPFTSGDCLLLRA